MADPNNGQTKTGPEEPKMELRLLIAFLLMAVVLFVTPQVYKRFFPAPAPVPAAQTTETSRPAASKAEASKPEASKPAEAAQAQKAEAAPAASTPQVSADKEQIYVIDTNLYRVTLSNKGGVVRSWTLKKYKDTAGKPLDLVNPAGSAKSGYPFALAFQGKKPPINVNEVLYAAKMSPDGQSITFDYSNGEVAVHKSFRFDKNSYLTEFSDDVKVNGAGLPNLVEWRGGFGDASVANAAGQQHSLFFNTAGNKLVIKSAKDAKDGPVTDTGAYSFAGMEDNYFAAVFLPQDGGQTTVRTVSDSVPPAPDAKDEPHVGAAVGGSAQNQLSVYVGPKDLNTLKSVNPKLTQLVDFGWFGLIAKPLFLAVNWLTEHLLHNYGWSIVVVTIIINFLLLPLKFSSMKSMKKMQTLQPQIQAINAKYKNVGLRDPRKQQQNQEVMELYKKHGVNPMGGCLPMIIQIPFFFAFYKVLTVATEMRGAHWLWVTDLSRPETLPIHILPIIMTAAQFIQQKMTPNPSADPNQQKMMLLMPLVFGFMFYNVSSGLVLYWLTSNLVGIGQQWFINRSMPVTVPAAQAEPAGNGKKSGSKKR
jgi:YidC/Oxa1 family membrane protein insertase